MAMPNHIVGVRHGLSEANWAREQAKQGNPAFLTPEFYRRPDRLHRLMSLGAEQAQAAGPWIARFVLKEFGLETFDRYYCSTAIRSIETAGNLGLPLPLGERWRQTLSARERDHGVMDVLTREEFRERHPDSAQHKDQDPLFWRPHGGESIAQVAETRVQRQFDTFHRQLEGGAVIIVSHGEHLEALSLAVEQPSVDEWHEWQDDPARKINNAQVLHYTRINPATGEQDPRMRWGRSVWPWQNPDDPGTWYEFEPRQYSNEDLLAIAAAVPPLFPGVEIDPVAE